MQLGMLCSSSWLALWFARVAFSGLSLWASCHEPSSYADACAADPLGAGLGCCSMQLCMLVVVLPLRGLLEWASSLCSSGGYLLESRATSSIL
jgi:hypothetical protein